MLVLQASEEQEQIFQKLIQTMGEQVVWNGRFLVRDDELILEGTVRSLIFQFETKKVTTNLVDVPYKEEEILDISRHPTLKDLVHMVLYAFGKWGTLRGLNVQQDYPQLNQLFAKILNTFYIEPSFRKENFRFYKVGVRVTYEEVLQTVLEYEKKQAEDPAAESSGLWHRLIWKNRERAFSKEETTLAERVEDRIGNNFYLVGYRCPRCQEKLHMAVYPEGKEVRIDTEEKGVYLARTYTCSHCNCFYTPRPDRLISEGLIYEMDFDEDQKAYEDYLELMGYYGERAANFKYNEYEAVRKQRLLREAKEKREALRPKHPDRMYSAQDALRQMEEFGKNFAALPQEVFQHFAHRVEEGFYPDAVVAKHEKKFLEEARVREQKKRLEDEASDASPQMHAYPDMELDDMGQARYTDYMRSEHGTKYSKDLPQSDHSKLPPSSQTPPNAAKQTRLSPDIDNTAQQSRSRSPLDAARQIKNPQNMASDQGQENPASGGRIVHQENPVSGGRIAHQENPASGGRIVHQENSASGGRIVHQENSTSGGQAIDQQDLAPDGQTSVQGNHTRGQQPDISHTRPHDIRQTQDAAQRAQEKHLENYYKRIDKLDRLSRRQKQELKKQILNDPKLDAVQKQSLTEQIAESEYQELAEEIQKKAEQNTKKNYAQLKKTIQETEQEDYPESIKGPYLKKLQELRVQRGNEEVRQLMEQMPQRMDCAAFQKLEQRLSAYEDVDLSPYQETLRQKREAAEKQEIAGMVKHSRKVSRGDYTGLMRRLEEQNFAEENIAPYMDKIKEKVTELDKDRLNELLDQAQQMDYQAAAAVYEQVMDENFLPELKNSALEMLAKRLEKIRTDECELLVQKLQEEMRGTIKENARHHFYPARKVMLNTAKPGETSAIDAALAAYAGGRSMFEYPIFSIDTSRSGSGREGMVLTPETLFYSTRTHAYEIPVSDIDAIEASTGLLNKKIMLTETNGAEHKLPYVVKTGEMEDWARILEEFIRYLQEKPASRKLKYLAKETHDTICCFRCGYVYQERDVCPECGYKKNR